MKSYEKFDPPSYTRKNSSYYNLMNRKEDKRDEITQEVHCYFFYYT